MRTYEKRIVSEIRLKRQNEKISYRKLAIIYKIPASTIRNWCKDLMISKSASLIVYHQLLRNNLKNSDLSILKSLKLTNKDELKLIAALLYGCEGAKYPATKAMCFTNSDPELLLCFYKLLKISFDLDTTKITLRLQIHSTHDYLKIRSYWSRLLDIPENRFLKPTITVPNNRKHHKNYKGTCTLKYQDYRLQLKLLGVFEGFLRLISSSK